ncbi:MAG: isopentenyl-diphosphate delta-isomerase, partial [Corynebacterium sp.]|nr:isopentenyl-diphosphate delta-isomerase [Corynebacterium sp.]
MTELVVLASAEGEPIGTAPKAEVHTTDTPLHFAFSAWLTCGGKVLVTRRALG